MHTSLRILSVGLEVYVVYLKDLNINGIHVSLESICKSTIQDV